MLVERVAVAVIVLTVLSSSRQEDLPLHRTLVRHDKLAQDKTRARKFFHHENTSALQDDTIRNISKRLHYGLAQQFKRRNDEERLKAESAGGGNGEVKGGKSAEEDDEDKKTLAQQVAEGKYGLIHTELFQKPPQRPGILNYKINPEVPKDNVNNLGGLDAEEIWLAENHLLVLAGGGFSKQRGQNWPPIDDYSAPRRQVKIPPNPKVPPPFPIQLTENGPIEIIRGVNGSFPRPLPFFPPSAGEINSTGVFPFFPPPPPGFSPGNFTGNGVPPPGFPFPFPPQLPNGSIPELPPLPPGFPPFPPANWTDLIDEDDPSIYYPPPYDFYFPKDNSSYVPAGPLVPGIVLPPPPDFFAPYDNATKPSKTKLQKGPVIKKVKYQPPKQYFDTPTKLPDIDNSVNTMTTPPYYYKTSTEPPRPTKPSVQVIQDYPVTDDITNEVTPSNNRDNKDDWVPIPAPHPYYITGPAKPLKENVLVIMSTPKQETDVQGYDYEVPVKSFKLPDRTVKYPKENAIPDFYNGNNDNHVYADEPLGKQYRPVTRKPKVKAKTTVAPAQDFHIPVRTGGKSLQATYYFYEDPHSEEDTGLTPPKPMRPLRPSPPSMPPPVPTQPIDFYSPKEPIHIKPRPITVVNSYNPISSMPINPYDLRKPTTSTTQRPSLLDYFSFNGEKNGGYNFMYPDSKPLLSPKSTSRPIFEYSYTAPGYKDETKRPNAMDFYYNSYPSTMTTSKPTDFLFNYDITPSTTPAPQLPPQPIQQQVFSSTVKPLPTPSPPQVLVEYETPTTTPRSQDRYNYQRTSTQKPWRDISSRKPLSPLSFTTPHPFYAFFTHHDESLVDDITKKYFTLFGQKIRKPGGGFESTTPLSELQLPNKHNTEYKYNYEPSKEVQYDDGDYSKQHGDYSKEQVKSNLHYSVENSNTNSQENYNFDQVRPVVHNNHNYDPYSNSQSQETYYQQDNYKTRGNAYHTGSSTENPAYSKYKLNTNSFRTTTVKPNTRLTYQQSSKRPSSSQLISVSNSFNVESEEGKHKSPSLEYDYDYDYDKHPAPSLQDDTRVNNYQKPYVKEYEAEWLPSLSQQYQDTRGDNGANQFISYKLPGNGNGHFFFLTPQAVQLEELANAFLFPSNVETRNNFYNKRNTNRTRRKPDETSTQSMKEKQSDKKSN
ncbi:uncharacterized protein LOC103508947 [Diaphorina citri]|uniref:Uncharacterized protein LOC103508947 n=1 Tax=Diaphorina citri TaxID=121845 RepID=A0A3Q0IXS2_DIACI|nr:uncharacterized protein LOC103508947 [Diaphorina citri]